MNVQRFRPVVAIDLDGVLRIPPTREGSPVREGIISAQITFRRDAYPTLHHSQPHWDECGEFTDEDGEEFSGVGVAWVHDLIRRSVEVVWATTWQDHANTYFSPILGFPKLPVAIVDNGSSFRDPSEWKIAQLGEDPRWAGRPLAWVDDDIPPGWDLERTRCPRDKAITLSHRVASSWRGLVQRDVDHLDAWLALASTPDGQAELRRRRRAELQLAATRRRRQRQRADRAERCEAALNLLLPEHPELARVLARFAGRPSAETITRITAKHDLDELAVRSIMVILTSFETIE